MRPIWYTNKSKSDIDLSGNVHFDYLLYDKLCNIKLTKIHDYPDEFILYSSISKYYNVPIENITIGFGATDILQRIIQTAVEHLYIVEPAFEMVSVYCDIHRVPYTKISAQQLANLSKDSQVYIANPNGNNGKAYDLSQYSFKLFIIDEAYSEFYKKYEKSYDENTIIIKTLSKSLGLAGLRVGFSFASISYTNILQAVRMNYITNSFASLVVPEVIEEIPKVVTRMNAAKVLLQNLYDCKPSKGNYVLFKQQNKLTDKFGFKLTSEKLYRMALADISTLDV